MKTAAAGAVDWLTGPCFCGCFFTIPAISGNFYVAFRQRLRFLLYTLIMKQIQTCSTRICSGSGVNIRDYTKQRMTDYGKYDHKRQVIVYGKDEDYEEQRGSEFIQPQQR